jgi:hypothetical protein
MRHLRLLALVLPLTLCGCLLTTGQIAIDFDLGTVNVTDPDNLVAEQVDLNTIQDYVDHKDDISGVSDLALLGEITNNLGSLSKTGGKTVLGGDPTLFVEAYITPTTTNYDTDTEVRANAVKLWGPLLVPPGATVNIDWDNSAALFSFAGKGTLINEIKGDGVFTIYVLGSSGFYDFTVTNATLVLTLEAKL